uniref:Ubiquitin-like protease family profile domain-containing protein n=1 Tax=Oryza glaberrima TaxID=4538 RepID=I1R671_ORYGL
MKRLHTFYMEASKKGLGNITARSPADCFGKEGYVWLDFSDLHAIYRPDKMDVNYVGVWCINHYIYLLIHPKDGTMVVLDPLDYRHQSYKEFLTILQYAYQYYKFKGGEQTRTREKLLLPRLECRTSFDDTGIKNVQRDLCHFIHHECCHVKGDFFDPEGALATSDEFKDLREWNSAMP